CGKLRGSRMRSLYPTTGITMVEVYACVVCRPALCAIFCAACNTAIQAYRQLFQIIAADTDASFRNVMTLCQLGNHVDRATDCTGTIKKTRWPAYGFHPVINPDIDGATGNAVFHVYAVVQLAQ